MVFKTIGKPGKPIALLIHAMFATSNMFNPLIELMQEEYFIVLPTLSAHTTSDIETPPFQSAHVESTEIINYLRRNNFCDIEILLGSSLGGIVAFDIFIRRQLTIHKIFLDGAPFIHLPNPIIKIMETIFSRVSYKSTKYPCKSNILDKMFPTMSTEMKKVCGHMSDRTIKNLTKTCYTYQLPKLIELSENQSVTFIYGTAEIARFSLPAIRKFKNCNFIIMKGYAHCSFLIEEPENYLELLQNT